MGRSNGVMEFILTLVIGAILFGGIFGVQYLKCVASTAEIGFPSKYAIFSGCLIEPVPGQWIPLENYRMFGD